MVPRCSPRNAVTTTFSNIYHNVIKKTSTNENKMIEGNTNEYDGERLNVTQVNCSTEVRWYINVFSESIRELMIP